MNEEQKAELVSELRKIQASLMEQFDEIEMQIQQMSYSIEEYRELKDIDNVKKI